METVDRRAMAVKTRRHTLRRFHDIDCCLVLLLEALREASHIKLYFSLHQS